MHTVFSTLPGERWKVVAADAGYWRTGLYRPEFESAEAVTMLEKHDCPELFVCAGGPMGLLLYDGEHESILRLEPGQAVMVADYHNGFSLSADGYFIVNERTAFVTDYIDRHTCEHLRQVVTS
jgi:hypothetical protein